MEIESFLKTEDLEIGANLSSSSRISSSAQLLFRLGERVEREGLHTRFHEFNPERLLHIEVIVKRINEMVQAARTGDFNEDIVLGRLAGIDEIAAVADIAGVLRDPEIVHIWDGCGGNGSLPLTIAYLRAGVAPTTATTIDRNNKRRSSHGNYRRLLAPNNSGFNFLNSDVGSVMYPNVEGRSTYCIAKHACGSATDGIIKKIAQQANPPKTAILTCCHGSAKNIPPEDTAVQISPSEWEQLAKIPDWNMADRRTLLKTTQRVYNSISRVAMRIMDVIRASAIQANIEWRVEEVLPQQRCPKNHCIVVG